VNRKIIVLCLFVGLVFCSLQAVSEEDLDTTLDDMGVKTDWDSTTGATPGNVEKDLDMKDR